MLIVVIKIGNRKQRLKITERQLTRILIHGKGGVENIRLNADL